MSPDCTTAKRGEGAVEGSRADLTQFLDRFLAAAWEIGGHTFAEEIEDTVLRLRRRPTG